MRDVREEPLFTVVIANYNYGRFLEEAIQSLFSQSCQDFELIVVDGGSTDNSVDLIRKYENRIAWWCSEPDRGQSDAFNKGFSQARGRFLTWLNADDVFSPRALEQAREAIIKHPDCEWFAGGCFWLDPELHVIKCSCARAFSYIRAKRGEISVWAPSSFFSRSLYERVGGVDVGFHYMMDTELWFRFHRQAGAIYRPIKGYCWGLRLHPEAKMSGHNFEGSTHTQQSHPKWEQMRKEGEIFYGRYGHPKNNRLMKWFTTSPKVFIKNRFDTWRFRGKPFDACFRAPPRLNGVRS